MKNHILFEVLLLSTGNLSWVIPVKTDDVQQKTMAKVDKNRVRDAGNFSSLKVCF